MSWHTMNRGWQDSEVFGNAEYSERDAWAWFIGEAEWRDTTKNIVGKPVAIKRGQFSHSVRFMSEKFQWSTGRVLRVLEKWTRWGMIEVKTDTGQNIITICKYEEYQNTEKQNSNSNSNSNADAHSNTHGNKEEPLNHLTNKSLSPCATLDDLSIDHIASWLVTKRVTGLYTEIDEHRLLEKFKDYCRSKRKRYDDWVAAFRNSFEWKDTPKKTQEGKQHEAHSRQPTKSERLKRAADEAVAEILAAQAGSVETPSDPMLRQLADLRTRPGSD